MLGTFHPGRAMQAASGACSCSPRFQAGQDVCLCHKLRLAVSQVAAAAYLCIDLQDWQCMQPLAHEGHEGQLRVRHHHKLNLQRIARGQQWGVQGAGSEDCCLKILVDGHSLTKCMAT